MGLTFAPARKAIAALIVISVICGWAYLLHGFSNFDSSPRPGIKIAKEIANSIPAPGELQAKADSVNNERYGLSVTGSYRTIIPKEELSEYYQFHARRLGWRLKRKSDSRVNHRIIYCVDDFAFRVLIHGSYKKKTVSFGAFWTADPGNPDYCRDTKQ